MGILTTGMILAHSKVSTNSYRTQLATHAGRLLKITNQGLENQSYLPKFFTRRFQCSTQPWPTGGISSKHTPSEGPLVPHRTKGCIH